MPHKNVPIEDLHPAIAGLRRNFPELVDETRYSDWVEFWSSGADDATYVRANVDELTERVRIRFFLPHDEHETVREWVESQPEPGTGSLQYQREDGVTCPRLVFMRPTSTTNWTSDPMFDELARYTRAWLDGTDVAVVAAATYSPADDPHHHAPENAWLIKASEAAYLSDQQLQKERDANARGVFELLWTASSQTKPGDLALIYYVAPRKAACFVARAASHAFFATDVEVNASTRVAAAQWWAYFTGPVEIGPLGWREIADAAGGRIQLQGRSGLYLRPELIERLPLRPRDGRDREVFDRVVVAPTGNPKLPSPHVFELEDWRAAAAGAFRYEDEVTRHLVRPLLEHLMPQGWEVAEQFPAGRGVGVPDIVLTDGRPRVVVEVKKIIRSHLDRSWQNSPDIRQLRRYQDALGVPGVLVDVHRWLLVDTEGRIFDEIVRSAADESAIDRVRQHVRSGGAI